MRALTLYPEWAWAILHLGKDVENRLWLPPRALAGQWVALHAGAHVGGRPGQVARTEGMLGLYEMAHRAGWMEVAQTLPTDDPFWWERGAQRAHEPMSHEVTRRAIVGIVRFSSPARSTSPWAVPGQHHWPILQVVALPAPVLCPGALGLWRVPEALLQSILPHVPPEQP